MRRLRPFELVSLVGRPLEWEWKPKANGYSLRKPGSSQFGFVRYNLHRQNAHRYTVYARRPFSDARKWAAETGGGNEGRFFVDPNDADAVGYVVSVLESAWDGRP